MPGDEPYPPDFALPDVTDWGIRVDQRDGTKVTHRTTSLEAAQKYARENLAAVVVGRAYAHPWTLLDDLDA